ncbi:basement membrane-specific heparan sulfate proteoglycan core protein-like [Anopheles albimanus]|uniref:basement membrane-specific heparan sulfate proteoglycan core protein-like n=1 Tax=Anopheles albimanus TaxID=7167 RepID=UPI00163F5EC9|nr:basement membrane-specific heparan sulfate proteoglycan core protein-like [Anopheles albimanus]
MAAVRCGGVRALQLLLLLAAASSRLAPVDATGQPATLVEAEKPYDSDLVFEDESSQLAASAAAAALSDTKPLLLDDIDRSPAGRSVEDMLLAVRGPTDDTVDPWDGADLSDDGDDEEEDESELGDEEEPELDESENEIGDPSQDNEDGAGQGWLMRSVKRIKRSLDSLWTSTDGAGSAQQQPNDTKRAQGIRKVKKTKKSNQEKKNKQKKKQKLKKTELETPSGVSEPSTVTVTSKARKAHPAGTAKDRLPAAQSLTAPATKFAGKSGRFVGVRPKRQYDYGPIDNEGSGDLGEGSGEPPLWVNYKLQLTIPEPYRDSFRKVDQSDERILRYQADLSRLVNDVALLDVEATITRMEPYTLNKQLTLVTANFDAPQNIDLDELEENIIKQLQGPGYSLRSDGVALTPTSDDGDGTTTSFPDEEEDDDTPETTVGPAQENKCRGDDQYRCGQTEVYICDVQKCDGNVDCPNGEDESAEECPSDCRPDEIFCDRKCLSPEKRCDRTPDCSNGIDEEGCSPEVCRDDEFTCGDGSCISYEKRCDRTTDCPDGSDEADNECLSPCDPESEFECNDGTCILAESRCDRRADCSEGEDEDQCSYAVTGNCTSYQFQCRSDRRCIPVEKHCDRVYDCADGSDEQVCECRPHEFRCQNGYCIAMKEHCDGWHQCSDGSDELGCPKRSCYDEEFTCRNGQCITRDQVCDGRNDCGDNSDETDLQCDKPCGPNEFTCYDGGCISKNLECDGIRDCLDGTDEIACGRTAKPLSRCGQHQFECNDGICIADYKRCNGIVDCHDESDEPESCSYEECNTNEFACDGDCFEFRIYCNGVPDCNDGKDEQNCITCHGDAFHCTSEQQCVPPEHRCDGVNHCRDGSDEIGCMNRTDCLPDQWQCRNEVCINGDFRCDRNVDCTDGSDEEDCEGSGVCTDDEFQCRDGSCIEADRRCDREIDCYDQSDELDCPPAPCEQLVCPDGTCFAHSQRCDRRRDCPDGFDEENCPCHSDEFTCGDGQCISNQQVCDRRPDCRDGSDERNCSCARNQFRCNSGQCIADGRRCDQRIDCPDGSDEAGCRPVGCRSNEWRCHSGDCIRLEQRCDRRPDCRDRSDESDCFSCGPNMFRCENGPCVNSALKCNGIVDCPFDTSDELDCPPYVPPTTEPLGLNLRTVPDDQTIKDVNIDEGNEVVFQCRDEGPAHAKVRWVRGNGLPLPPGTRDINGRLEIPNIRVDHSGTYVCEAVGYSKLTAGSTKEVTLEVTRSSHVRPPSACAVDEATCSNGECIRKSQICDGNRDCDDGSDETSCSLYHKCEPNQFKCANRKCVLKTWLCDGEQDCGDGSDEENCATLPPNSPCRYDEFQCRNGQCVPKSFQCDTHPDCFDKSDEVGCMAPSVIQPPPPSLTIQAGGVLNITCRATAVPVPLIVWRLNWGHVPEKCISTSENGFGRLVCGDMQPIDAGAYSCEIINSMGTHFVSPDTIVTVISAGHVCQQGYFNSKARNPSDCINCFCFGVATTCNSADLYTYALKPPVSSLTVVGVEGPWLGRRELMIGEFENHNLTAQRHGVQLRLTNLVPGRRTPYYSLPEEYKGNQLKSYGGSIRYDVEYDGNGRPINAPDVILKGNGVTLFYTHSETFYPDIKNHVSVSLLPGHWMKEDRSVASRGDIMMLLANIESILIRMQYVDGVERNIELVNIMMDSAAVNDRGLGSASLVEECRCPPGYRGLSCESCEPGYVRQSSGPWLGRCVPRLEECRPGYYGDPNRGIPCQPCPCPVAGEKSRARSCYLDSRDNVVCRCDRGYAGERCMECDVGYVGNPLGEGCFPRPVSNCNALGTERILGDGRCYCKPDVEGQYCDRCSAQHFYLHDKGCIQCFCMGVSNQCSSTTLTRDTIQASFADGHSAFSLISDYTNPSVVANRLPIANREIVYRNFGASDETFYWRLPTQFLGNKLTSFGGHLNYTLRYTPHSSGGVSRNNSPDVVLHSGNKIKLHHYRTNSAISSVGSSTNSVPILEDFWQNYEDGNTVNREYLLMALANVSDIFIKATYNTVSNEAALSHVSLDIARDHPYGGGGARAWPVEQCQCPEGHIGLSCEDCAPGYYKGPDGLYLGLCERCQCNGHSDECDSQTGACLRCRDNTYGPNCEFCLPGFVGNATGGTPYDCTDNRPESSIDCTQDCDVRGFTGRCVNNRCECKQLVEGRNCDQCRPGSFGLSARHATGCLECFCSGVTKSCGSSNLYREELPVLVDEFDNTISLANRDGQVLVRDNFNINPSINEISYTFRDRETYYWNLPNQVLGSQILSYGANLTVTQQVEGGRPMADQDIILIGNGLKLVWSRDHYDDGTYSVPLLESYWTVISRRMPYPATRSDLLTVLANLDHILIRATTRESTYTSRLSDIVLGTAVSTRNYNGLAEEVEMCRCPPGYRGTSCELCEDLHYRDHYDRRAGLLGSCKRCPCENADSCQMTGRGEVVCNCREGYTGDNCDNRLRAAPVKASTGAAPIKLRCSQKMALAGSETSEHYEQYHKCDNGGLEVALIYKNKRSHTEIDTRPPVTPANPVIEVTINVPSIKIVEVGDEFRADCQARHLVSNRPIEVVWNRENGRMPDGAFTDRGTLIITNIQITDGGSYVCRAGSGPEVVYKQVTITVSEQVPAPPNVTLSSNFVDEEEYQRAEVSCTASGYPTPYIIWERVDKPMPYNINLNDQGLLRFNSLRLQDTGTYRCLARNDVGESDAMLTVYVRPAGGPVVPPPVDIDERVEIMPSSFDGQPGAQIRLVCQCSPTARVTWAKQGEQRLPVNANVRNEILIIEHASQENSGRYICTAQFPTGRVKVSTVDVVINEDTPPQPNRIAPRVSPLNKSYMLVQGTDFSLPCEATGTPFPTIKWTLSGKPFESNVQQSSNVLRIFNAQPSNGGVYICVANNEEGMDRAYTVIEIDRRERPVLELYPSEPQTIKVGESVRLSCRASAGVPYPTITWVRKDRKPLSTRFTNDAEGVITLREATLEDAGEYECRAENIAGTAALANTIEVLQPPMITLVPYENHKITVNDDFTIYCSATGKPAPTLTLTPPRGTSRSAYQSPVEGLREVTLQLYRAELNDAGTYECRAVNAAGEDSQYLTLQVDPKRGDIGPDGDDNRPLVTDRPRPYPPPPGRPDEPVLKYYTAVLGDQITLTCTEEQQAVQTEWRRSDGRPLPNGSRLRGGNLTIENAGRDMAGLYDCIVRGLTAQPMTLVRIQVEVIAPLKISFSPPMPMTVLPGDQVSIYCNVTGEEPIWSYWHGANNRSLPTGVTEYRNYLHFSSIRVEDAGRYYCTARNAYGNTTRTAEVIVNRNEMVPNQPVYGKRYYEVTRGSTIRLDCQLPSRQEAFLNVQYQWVRREGALPARAHINGKTLQLENVTPDDAGHYECIMYYPNKTVVYDTVELAISREGGTAAEPWHPSVSTDCRNVDYQCPMAVTVTFKICIPRQWVCPDNVRYICQDRFDPASCTPIVLTDSNHTTNSTTARPRIGARKRRPVRPHTRSMKEQPRAHNGRPDGDGAEVDRPKRKPTFYFAPESLPILQLEPARSYVRPGESITVDCTSSAGSNVPIRWEKADGTALPYNIRQDGNRLLIANAREDDTGRYTCICYTDDGLRYITNFELQVEDNTIPDIPRTSSRIEYADRGTTARLQCNNDLYPATYQWSRSDGELPADQDQRASVLVLPNVQASDAGTYICKSKSGGQSANVVITLIVNNIIPFFAQSPVSYIEYRPLDDAFFKFYFEITFKPEKLNGLLLYSAQRGSDGDFIALSLNAGYPQFRFRFGGEQVMLQPDQPVRRGEWHTVKVNRVRTNGFLLVNDQAPVNFPDRLRFYGLNLDGNLYVGGVPNLNSLPAGAIESREGFIGCISQLKVNGREVQLYQDAISTVGLTACETCAEDPCNNGAGTCMESQTTRGYKCLCREGYTGANCETEGAGCSIDTCGVGRCEETDRGSECYCPLHKTGDRCQYTEHYTDATLAFKDGSYAAYEKLQTKRTLRFRFKADSLENGILAYTAENEQSYGDYMAVILNDGAIELRYTVAGKIKPLVLRSTVPIQTGRWYSVSTGRVRNGSGFLQVDEEPVISNDTYRNIAIMLKSMVYVGGYDKRLVISKELGVTRGFEGCIAELETSGNKVNMIEDIRDSANVYHCGTETVAPPRVSDDDEYVEGSPVPCRPGRSGPDCQTITDICLEERPCQNGGVCQTLAGGLNYTCICPPGYLGLRCETQFNTIVAPRFHGNGFVEISPQALEKGPNQLTTEIAIMFSAYQDNGLLLWYGQRNDEEYLGNDYIALAIQDGYVELTVRMDGQESTIRSDGYIADEEQHVALIRRHGNQFHLEMDSLTVHGETRPTGKQMMYLPGSIYIGGVPDIERFTGNRYNESFNGCVFSIENNEKRKTVELRDWAIRSVNVDACDDVDLGTEPPVV